MHRALRSTATLLAFVSLLARGAMSWHVQKTSAGAKGLEKPTLAGMLDRFIVVPEHKLLFCYMEKVGCMNFNELFRQVRLKFDPTLAEGISWYRNTPIQHGLTKEDLENIMVNESWHKAVFWRNPAERFASSFQSKCDHADWDGEMHCESQFGVPELSFPSAIASITFKDAFAAEAGKLESSDEDDDEHFKRMGTFCGGLKHSLGHYDTVEELTKDTSRDTVSKLLRTVGIEPAEVPLFDALFPAPKTTMVATAGEFDPGNVAKAEGEHNTGTASQMEKLYPLTQPWLMEAIVHHYRSDYDLFGINMTAQSQHAGFLKERWPLLDPA